MYFYGIFFVSQAIFGTRADR